MYYFMYVGQTSSSSKAQSAALENELTGAKHELLKVQEMLEMAEKVWNFPSILNFVIAFKYYVATVNLEAVITYWCSNPRFLYSFSSCI
jgi:Leucine zipper